MTCSSSQQGDIISVCPYGEVRFKCDAPRSRAPFTITNTHRCPVAFKIKTTSPEKFRVRPSCGVIACGCSITVEVVLCEGVSPRQVLCDKFLVVATPVQRENICAKELYRLWKCVPQEQRYEHRLRCVLEATPPRDCGPPPASGLPLRCLADKLECLMDRVCARQRLVERAARLQEQNQRLITMCLYILAALAVANAALLLTAYRAFSGYGGGLVFGLIRRASPSCGVLWSWLI
ncbi:motile sperm domain-containing protein 2-like [Pollicipes pollicipes]|uniref:motile sperm domain-containing protein 2-like n=1 Tax=Pollicipes pollicipes TaxID=41117 RepID=UPI001884ACB7|nr:motile sperm domain-containing protein 2-like [Pollicipes pollicipes]